MDPSTTTANLRQAGTTLANATGASRLGGDNNLGKDDFLKLLMAQVTHQDPLNPMDSEGMMNQLTQMGALEQMININGGIGKLADVQADIARANAYTFLDKDVSVRGNHAAVQGGRPVNEVAFQLPQDAQQVTVTVVDAQGSAVRSMELGATAEGHHEIAWDGLNNAGLPVDDGRYQFNVAAKSNGSDAIAVDMFTRGKVSGLRFSDGRPLIQVNGRELDIRDVVELSNRSEKLFAGRLPLPLQSNFAPKPPLEEPRQ